VATHGACVVSSHFEHWLTPLCDVLRATTLLIHCNEP
jgi:hypothetical protein